MNQHHVAAIVKALNASGRPMLGREIAQCDGFETESDAFNALSQISKLKDGPVAREKEDGSGKFKYWLRPGADITKFLSEKSDDAGELVDPDDGQFKHIVTHVSGKPNGGNGGAPASAAHQDIPAFIQSSAEAPAESAKPKPVPAKVERVPELALPELDKINRTQPVLVAFKGEHVDEDPVDVCIDTLLIGLVLRLPNDGFSWTKPQRQAWQTAFDAVVDFLFPESK